MTLQPHQSQTVTFTITGHELSYFNTAANGWTLPTGRFSLYVGDSSALTSLPLRGTLNVTKTIGNRYVRLTAPTTVEPGATFTAKAQFVNHGNLPITDGTVRFGVPSDVDPRSSRRDAGPLAGARAERDPLLPCHDPGVSRG